MQFSGYWVAGDPELLFRRAVEARLGELTLFEAVEAWRCKDIGLAQWPYLPLSFRLDMAGALSAVKLSNTPSSVLEQLANERGIDVRWMVVRHPATLPATRDMILEQLAKDEDGLVRRDVASCSLCPPSVLELLASDKDPDIRSCVAENPGTPQPLLDLLAKDQVEAVRKSVTEGDGTRAYMRELAARNRGKDVDVPVAQDTDTPEQLAEARGYRPGEEDDEAADYARWALEGPPEGANAHIRRDVAANPGARPLVLERLAQDEDQSVRKNVGSNPGTPSLILDAMAHEGETESVLVAVLTNASCTAELAKRIWAQLVDPRRGRWYRDQMSGASPEERQAAERDDVFYFGGKDANKAVVARRPVAPLMALCSGREIDPARLARVANSKSWLVRAAVARNHGTPADLLERVAKDEHPLVRALAAR